MHALLSHDFHSLSPLVYVLIFFGLILEGEAVLFTTFYLVEQHNLILLKILPVIIAGVLIGDTLWFFGSRFLSKLFIFKIIFDKTPKKLDQLIKKKWMLAIIMSKFMYGFHRPTLFRLHAFGLRYRDFLRADVLAAFLWILVIGSLGYFFSSSFLLLKGYIRFSEIGLVAALLFIFFLFKFMSKFIIKKCI